MASDARIQETGWKDFSFLGNRNVGESRRYRVAVLESHGLHARGSAGHPNSATKFQIRILGEELSEQGVACGGIFPCPVSRLFPSRVKEVEGEAGLAQAYDVVVVGGGFCGSGLGPLHNADPGL